MPIIPTAWKTETGRITVQDKPQQKVRERLHFKKQAVLGGR
jgi:hypothetical protein